MILKQYYLNCLAHASYLIGDQSSGTAVVVDPQRDIDAYLEDASKNGLTIRPRLPHALPRRLPCRSSRAAQSDRRQDSPWLQGAGRVRVHADG
jgi:hypothetical protein